MDGKTVDERYRDLQHVERNFRTVKTTFQEIRPIFLRKAERTGRCQGRCRIFSFDFVLVPAFFDGWIYPG